MPIASIAQPMRAMAAMTAAADGRATETKAMLNETKSPNKFSDLPRDKPQGDRVEHGNLERPGAQAHPRARSHGNWSGYTQRRTWPLR